MRKEQEKLPDMDGFGIEVPIGTVPPKPEKVIIKSYPQLKPEEQGS